MAGDFPIFSIAGTSEEFLTDAIELGLMATGHSFVKGYYADQEIFVLFWYECDQATSLPAQMTSQQITPMIWAWLESTANYGRQPDHDGDNGKGWHIFTEDWGQIGAFGHQSFLAIKPWWAMYGK